MPLFPYSDDGYFYALGSAFFGGSWQPLTKSSKTASLHPAAKSVYFSAGIFAAAWMNVILDQDVYVFTSWGIASGALLTFTVALNVTVVIPGFGVAKATSIISGIAVVTSVCWNYIMGTAMRSQVGTWAGVAVVIFAMTGMVFGKEESTESSVRVASAGMPLRRVSSKGTFVHGIMDEREDHEKATAVEAPLVVTSSDASRTDNKVTHQRVPSSTVVITDGTSVLVAGRGGAGFGSMQLATVTLVCGIMAGSILVPMDYADEEFQSIAYIPSMAIGCVAFVVPVTIGQFWIEDISTPSAMAEQMQWPDAAPHSILSGCIYAVAIACNIKSIDDLSYATAMVLMQTQIIVAGMWGILLYGELKGQEVYYFFMWGAILVGGALMAGYYGTVTR